MHIIIDIQDGDRPSKDLGAMLGDSFRVLGCRGRNEALLAIGGGGVEAILVDLDAGGFDPMDMVRALGSGSRNPPLIVLSEQDDPQAVIAAIRAGAVDYVRKSSGRGAQCLAIARAIERKGRSGSPLVIGKSSVLRSVIGMLERSARWDFPVLITGESGTGKDLAARMLHGMSRRKTGPFVPRNCAALPEALIESELFGSTRGAFTGALDRPGAFEQANGGTLFLDEIGEASPEIQAKLLRVLESEELWPLGARKPVSVDARLIFATNRNLEDHSSGINFRTDLLYRIETLRVHIPPLRERLEDISPLARHFVRETGAWEKDLSDAALDRLLAAPWPGNVRQLRNVIQRAIVMSEDRDVIGPDDIVIY
ncbi:MAG: sigma-54-dependent transcriptional regulator [Rectinemataceae bacterium]